MRRKILGLFFVSTIVLFGSRCANDDHAVSPGTNANANADEFIAAETHGTLLAKVTNEQFTAEFIEISPGIVIVHAAYSMDAPSSVGETVRTALISSSYSEKYQHLGGKDAEALVQLRAADTRYSTLGELSGQNPMFNGRSAGLAEKTELSSARAMAYTCYDKNNDKFSRQSFHNTYYKLGVTIAEMLNFGKMSTPFSAGPPFNTMSFTFTNGNWQKNGFQKSFIKFRFEFDNAPWQVYDLYDRSIYTLNLPATLTGVLKTSGPALDMGCLCGHLVMDVK